MNIFIESSRNFNWSYLYLAAAALLAISFHEMSHGFIAYRLGDPTGKTMGRLTLNPIKHIDVFGILMLVIVGFGWAKPVPVDIRYFKNPKTGMAYTALAGPLSNLLLAFLSLLIIAALVPLKSSAANIPVSFLMVFANINIGLGIFNLLPIPPLDGSKILFSLLPDNIYYNILQFERYGSIILMIILSTRVLSPFLSEVREAVFYGLWVMASTPVNWLYGLLL